MKALQKKTAEIFYDVESRYFLIVNDVLATLTILSVLSIVLETVPALANYTFYFNSIEYISVAFFTLEYIGRIIANKKDYKSYIFSFYGLIDLLAILPTYVGLTNLTFLKTVRILRILRLLRMMRLAKVARLERKKLRDIEDYTHLYRLNIKIYFFALFSAIILFGTFIYIIEESDPVFSSIPLGMLWASKVIMGGIAQQIPSTPIGEIVAILTRFTGLILFGLLIVMVGNPIRRFLFGSEELDKK